MLLSVKTVACARGACLPLAHVPLEGIPAQLAAVRPPFLPVGAELGEADVSAGGGGEGIPSPAFKVCGRALFRAARGAHAVDCPLVAALRPFGEGEELALAIRRTGRALAWITLSDKGFAGEREDASGPLIARLLGDAFAFSHVQGFLLPDDEAGLRALFTELALRHGYDLIVSTGGTGLAPRDRSPEAALAAIERRLPGFEQAMMSAGLQKTPTAAVSRAVAGTIGQSLLICLPGSAKAVAENLGAVIPALKHALDKLQGDTADCGRI
jgi:molybdenum cofactor synthesis domain-containing protein